MHKLTRHTGRIIQFPGRGRQTLILTALSLAAAGALLAAPASASAMASQPTSHVQAAISHPAKTTVHTASLATSSGAKSHTSCTGSYLCCPPSYLCFWVNANWGGNMGKLSGTNPWWGDFSDSECKGGTWNDCASALYNHGNNDNAVVYQNINYSGGSQCIAQRTTFFSDLANNYYDNGTGSNMNDSISSNSWTSHACS